MDGNGWLTTYSRDRYRLIVLMPDDSLQDVTDEWVTGLPVRVLDTDYEDCLVRIYASKCVVFNDDDGGCEVEQVEKGSYITTDAYGGYAPPAAQPDPLGECTILNRKLPDPNPLP